MNFWLVSSGADHFLISDNSNHLASGFHSHGTGQQPGQKIDVVSIDDEVVIMAVIKKFTNMLFEVFVQRTTRFWSNGGRHALIGREIICHE